MRAKVKKKTKKGTRKRRTNRKYPKGPMCGDGIAYYQAKYRRERKKRKHEREGGLFP